MNVQHELDNTPAIGAADTHVSVWCPACGSLHLANTTTLLGDPSARQAHAKSGA
ncbi:hypothetical protein [Bradyrhizobium cenepequi]|uniref:hypothetical protein n=1 Tax=Bradyrhizobium cenepequi TaxID=2821403 RepID=UPI001CE2908E|nr:hypothetical protein [Bradyrhizobium cenepequi]